MGKDWYNDVYLKSDAWMITRNVALRRFGHRCALCAETEDLHVHHNTYERVGDEDPHDLCVLCEDCHYKVHAWDESIEFRSALREEFPEKTRLEMEDQEIPA